MAFPQPPKKARDGFSTMPNYLRSTQAREKRVQLTNPIKPSSPKQHSTSPRNSSPAKPRQPTFDNASPTSAGLQHPAWTLPVRMKPLKPAPELVAELPANSILGFSEQTPQSAGRMENVSRPAADSTSPLRRVFSPPANPTSVNRRSTESTVVGDYPLHVEDVAKLRDSLGQNQDTSWPPKYGTNTFFNMDGHHGVPTLAEVELSQANAQYREDILQKLNSLCSANWSVPTAEQAQCPSDIQQGDVFPHNAFSSCLDQAVGVDRRLQNLEWTHMALHDKFDELKSGQILLCDQVKLLAQQNESNRDFLTQSVQRVEAAVDTFNDAQSAKNQFLAQANSRIIELQEELDEYRGTHYHLADRLEQHRQSLERLLPVVSQINDKLTATTGADPSVELTEHRLLCALDGLDALSKEFREDEAYRVCDEHEDYDLEDSLG